MRPRLLIALVPALLVATACSGGSGAEFTAGDDYSVGGALAQIPVGGADDRVVVTADLTAATEVAGLERPGGFDQEAIANWLMPLTTPSTHDYAPVFVPMAEVFQLDYAGQMADFDAELGWSLLDVDAFVERNTSPNTFTVITGPDLAVNPDLPEVSDGVVTAGEGEDEEVDLAGATVARPMGIPLRMALDDDRLAASPMTPAVSEWLDGPPETLADDEALAAIAAALDDADVISAVVDGTDRFALKNAFGGQASPEAVEAISGSVPADPFTAVGIGWGFVDGQSRITVAYYFGDAAAAEAAVPVFEKQYGEARTLLSSQPMSDSFTLVEAKTDGPVAILTVEPNGASPGIMWSWYNMRDLAFLHR